MTPDPIVEEMRKYGLEFTARHNHDMAAICKALREKQQTSQRPVVNRIQRPAQRHLTR